MPNSSISNPTVVKLLEADADLAATEVELNAQIHRKKELFPIEAEVTEFESLVNELETEIIEVFDYEQMREDYGL